MVIKKRFYSKKEKIVISCENYKDVLEYLNQFETVSKVKIWYDNGEILKGYTCEIYLEEGCYND